MQNKLFVGNLSWDTDDAGLKSAFEEYGNVSDARVITDRETGRSRGFGFVTFEDPEDAQEARQDMDNTTLDGRGIRVDWATERKPAHRNGGGGGSGFRDAPRGNYGGDRRGGGGRGGGRRNDRGGGRDW